MTPQQFQQAATTLYGRKHWKRDLARDLGVYFTTIHRIMKREQIPGPYEVALKGMLANHQARVKLEKEARKLLPRKFRKRSPRATAAKAEAIKKRKLIKAAGC